jgi:hypothetical protein
MGTIVRASTQCPEDRPRSYRTPELRAPEVWPHAQAWLEEHLPLPAEGDSCTTEDLFTVWLGIAATKSTLEAVCRDLGGTPAPPTIRGYLNEPRRVEELPALEPQLNAALTAEGPRRVRRQAQEVASDYHDRPYSGETGARAVGARPSHRWPDAVLSSGEGLSRLPGGTGSPGATLCPTGRGHGGRTRAVVATGAGAREASELSAPGQRL